MMEEQTEAAALAGEAGSGMMWTDFKWNTQDAEYCYFTAQVRSDWYKASVPVETSRRRLKNYYDDVARLLKLEQGKADFINENGNFEINLTLSKRGNITVKGILIKSMAEDARLEYIFETELASVERFHRRINVLLRQD